ncbi:MAG TPA: VWA domain-containing protein [Arenibaculum sp.]|nr:VWA domain-containing protein [Arenibaculum sp.]
MVRDTRDLSVEPGGRLALNIMHFARALRAAGLPVGPGKVLQAIEAVEAVGIGRRRDFSWTLHAVFVNRRDQRELFDQAFHVFWRNPEILKRMMALLLPALRTELKKPGPELSPRLADALQPRRADEEHGAGREQERPEIEIDATMTWSGRELLQRKDFEKMTALEAAAARAVIRDMSLPLMTVRTRRFEPSATGNSTDMRASLRRSLRSGGAVIELARRRRRVRHPPLVALCDISGSMSQYSRMLLHFLHAVTNDRDRVHTFLFGTRLTNVTRHLRHKDVDVALEKVAANVEDWSGGTRIGRSLEEFNRVWSRRVLGQGAVVLLITDGLDRDAGKDLDRQMERLHKSCRRLIWLNPLLRYEGFQPKSSGIRAIMPHVDDFRPVHNLASIEDLARALTHVGPRRVEGMRRWLEEVA